MKIKVIHTMKKTAVTDDEITPHMDFDLLMKSYQQQQSTRRFGNRQWFLLIAFIVAVVSLLVWRNFNHVSNPTGTTAANVQSTPVASTPITEPAKEIPNTTAPSPLSTSAKPSSQVAHKPPVKVIVEQPKFVEAEPASGYDNFYQYVNTSLQKLSRDKKLNLQVVVSFSIDEKGAPQDIVLDKSNGSELDHEIIDIIKKMPTWKPATLDGKPVSSKLSIPFSFSY